MDKADRIKFYISLLFRILLAIAVLMSIYTKNWINLTLSLLTLLLTYLPSMCEKRFKIDYPGEFEILILIFIFASIYLGEVHAFYTRFWWWDIFLHFLSSLIMGVIAFSLVVILNKEKGLRLSPGFIALFAFTFAVSAGAVWEIFEFSMDYFIGTNMQKSGLFDTMADLIVDTLGALVISLFSYLYIKGRFKRFEIFEKRFFALNPDLIGKKIKKKLKKIQNQRN